MRGVKERPRHKNKEKSWQVYVLSDASQEAQVQRAELLMQLGKRLEPEEIAYKLEQFDPGTCTQTFLSELQRVLPSPEEVSAFLSVSMRYLRRNVGW